MKKNDGQDCELDLIQAENIKKLVDSVISKMRPEIEKGAASKWYPNLPSPELPGDVRRSSPRSNAGTRIGEARIGGPAVCLVCRFRRSAHDHRPLR
ncbi:hypothetical protein [Lysobacter enzymogenes]|nr:hypothetical protein [Lysobacter enzymogenes]